MHQQLMTLAGRHEITLATLRESVAPAFESTELRRLGIDVHHVHRLTRGPGAWGRRAAIGTRWALSRQPLRQLAFRLGAMQALINRLCFERTFDLIQVEDSAMGAYRYPSTLPKILTDHEVRSDLPADRQTPFQGLCGRLASEEGDRWRRVQPVVWRRFDRVQVFTQRDAAALASVAPAMVDRVRINPFGIDIPPPATPSEEAPGTLVFVGGFRHPPNVDAALWLGQDIWPRLRSSHPELRLWIVGSDPPRSVLALRGGGITVTGFVSDVERFVRSAAIVVAPLRLGNGMRVKVAQAMALGKAVVTTSLGAEGMVEEGQEPVLDVADDAASFADCIAALLASPDRRRNMGERAHAHAKEHLTWARWLERWEHMVEELIRSRQQQKGPFQQERASP
jgi:glycosyltransferase involved in cell wall biosynthesis